MRGNRVEQFLRDAIWVGVQKSHPQQVVGQRKFLQQLREAVAQAQVFTVRSRVLADKGDFPRAGLRQILRLAHHRFESAAAKRATKLWNNAKRAGMVAAFSDLDVGRVFRRGDDARRQVVIKKRGRLRGEHAKVAFHRFLYSFNFACAHHRIHFRNLF